MVSKFQAGFTFSPCTASPASPVAPFLPALLARAMVPQFPAFAQVSKRASAYPRDTELMKRTGKSRSSRTSWTFKLCFCATVNVNAQVERILCLKQFFKTVTTKKTTKHESTQKKFNNTYTNFCVILHISFVFVFFLICIANVTQTKTYITL